MTSVFTKLALALLLPVTGYAQLNTHQKNIPEMQKNKQIVQQLYEEALNKRKMELLREFVADEYTAINGQKGATGFEASVMQVIKAFPDAQWKLRELVAEGDKVIVQWKMEGTHTGPFQHIAATGKAVSNPGIGIYQMKDGKVLATQIQTDRLGFLQQLGVLPADPAAKGTKETVSFIDKFFVPASAKEAFLERVDINRRIIKKLPGFITDAVYHYTDDKSNLVCITIAQWESREALDKAKETVQEAYRKQGFDAAEMFKRLNIVADRGVYTALEAQ